MPGIDNQVITLLGDKVDTIIGEPGPLINDHDPTPTVGALAAIVNVPIFDKWTCCFLQKQQ